jgi:Tol biopolymer transport system component
VSSINGLDWSPDGRTIAYSAAEPATAIPRIHLLSLGSLSRRDLTSSSEHCLGEIEPAFSPDGRFVAFIRIDEARGQDACVVPIEGGDARKLDMEGRRVSGVDWLSRRDMIVSAASKLDVGLWKVPIDSDERNRLAIPGGKIQRISLARSGRHLTYEKISFARNIWCIDVSRRGECRRREQPLIASTQRESEPVVSPDGRSIAFVSDRSGSPEIWIADDAGGHARRLTNHQATQLTRPRWSPDGTQIAYSCNADGPSSIYVTEIQSQVTRRLLPGGPQTLAVWSRQDDDIYYQVDAPGGWEVWRVHPDGRDPRLVSAAGTTIIDETSDGRGLFCVESDEPGIWLLPIDGGPKSLVVPSEKCGDWQEVIVAGDGFYFTRRDAETSTLGFYDLSTGRSDSLASLQWYAASLALSPDRSMLLYDCIGDIEVDLMLSEIRP